MEHTHMVEPGQIVYCKSGRDAGLMMMILEILDNDYVLLVDGKRRTLGHPKKKNIKHLQKTHQVIAPEHRLVDRHIRNEIKYLIHGQEEM